MDARADIAHQGHPIAAVDDGVVSRAGYMVIAGRAVIITHSGGYETRYYLNSIAVSHDQEVARVSISAVSAQPAEAPGPSTF